MSYHPLHSPEPSELQPLLRKTTNDTLVDFQPTSKISTQKEHPKKKYRKTWLEYVWDREVLKGYVPRFVYVALWFTLMGAWIGGIFNFAQLYTKTQEGIVEKGLRNIKADSGGRNLSDMLVLQARLRQFKTTEASLTVQWNVVTIKPTNKTTSKTTLKPFVYGPKGLGFYPDIQIIYDPESTEQLPELGTGFFSMLDNLTAPRLGVLGAHEWDSVDTEIDMGPVEDVTNIWTQPLFGYPWDV